MSADAFTKEKFEAMIAMLDKDGDGTVSDQEFFAVWKDMNSGQFSGDEAALNAAAAAQWKIIDSDGDGNLTVQELATYYGFNFDMGVATAMTDEQILNVLAMQASLLAQEEDKAKKEKLQAAQAEAKTKPERDKTIKTIVMDEGKRRRSSKEIDDSASTSAHIDFLSCCKIGDLESSDPEVTQQLSTHTHIRMHVRIPSPREQRPGSNTAALDTHTYACTYAYPHLESSDPEVTQQLRNTHVRMHVRIPSPRVQRRPRLKDVAAPTDPLRPPIQHFISSSGSAFISSAFIPSTSSPSPFIPKWTTRCRQSEIVAAALTAPALRDAHARRNRRWPSSWLTGK